MILRKYQSGGLAFSEEPMTTTQFHRAKNGELTVRTRSMGGPEIITVKDKKGNVRVKTIDDDKETIGYWDNKSKPESKILYKKEDDGFINLIDTRTVLRTTGNPLVENETKDGKYKKEHVVGVIKAAKKYNVSPKLALAVALQETGLGNRAPENIGQVTNYDPNKSTYDNLAYSLKQHLAEADKLKYKEKEYRLQVYNGMGIAGRGKLGKHAYGMDVPEEGFHMGKNPLYGKQVYDLFDNVIDKNPELIKLIRDIYSEKV